jgi:hypothetical protein
MSFNQPLCFLKLSIVVPRRKGKAEMEGRIIVRPIHREACEIVCAGSELFRGVLRLNSSREESTTPSATLTSPITDAEMEQRIRDGQKRPP